MSGIPLLFSFKCEKGHLMKVLFPPGTRIDDEDETTCTECLDAQEVKPAYVVCVEFKPEGKKDGHA